MRGEELSTGTRAALLFQTNLYEPVQSTGTGTNLVEPKKVIIRIKTVPWLADMEAAESPRLLISPRHYMK